jgi:hypothetical protein
LILQVLSFLNGIKDGTMPPVSLDDSDGTAEYSNGMFAVVLPFPAKWE